MDNQNFNQNFNQNAPTNKPQKSNGKGMSVAALVLGLIGIAGSFIPVVSYYTSVCAILGLIFGVIGRKKSTEAFGKPSGIATAGLVLGIIGTALAVMGWLCTIACIGVVDSVIDAL